MLKKRSNINQIPSFASNYCTMSWKKSLPFFVFQSIQFATSVSRFFQHWSYYQRWKSSFAPDRNSVADELPWLNYPAVEFLQKEIKPGARVFEFGGGGSTIFFCKNEAEVTTVEDNTTWYTILMKHIESKGYKHWKGLFVPPVPVPNREIERSPSNPDDFMSATKAFANLSFENYAKAINEFPEVYFDVILVDGRARPSCIKQAIPHLKLNGLLVVDNTEREYYLSSFKEVIQTSFKVEMHQFAPVAYTPDYTRTTILRKIR